MMAPEELNNMDTLKNVPWFYVQIEDVPANLWLDSGGRDLLDSYGYGSGDHEWLLPKSEFHQFEEAAEAVPDYDLDPYYVDEMWDWDEVQHTLLRWGWR